MDTVTLVDEQIDDGYRLLDQLAEEGFIVRVACWVKPVDEDRWTLYIASPAVDEKGPLDAYGKLGHATRSLTNTCFTGSDIKLVGEKHRVARDLLDIVKRFPGRAPTWLPNSSLGGIAVEAVYRYPSGKKVEVTIYGLVYRGDPSGGLHLSFKPHKPHQKIIETEPSGVCNEYPAETGIDWVVAAPEGAKLEPDNELGIMKLGWDCGSKRRQSSANEVMALADFGRYGFRILHKPAGIDSTPEK